MWVKRVGNNPDLRVLLLHGGPGSTHEYLEACDSFLPGASMEYYYYDQLGSGFSDQPEDLSLWELDRFVDEVEQVRQARAWTPATSCCTASRGAGSWAWSTPCTTSSTCAAWSSPT